MVANAEKKIQITSTQDFCQVEEVTADGIIITKDHRYVKILQFTPINFLLRSATDQNGVIADFAGFIRILPPKAQIKVVTRPADTEGYVQQLQADMRQERNANCKILQQEQISLVEQVGRERGVSRQFFVIFEMDRTAFGNKKPTYSDIVQHMLAKERAITSALSNCGNTLINPPDVDAGEQQLSYLYEIYSRGKSEIMTYEDRRQAAFMEFLQAYGMEEDAILPVTNIISPEKINTKFSSTEMLVDGKFYSFCYIPGRSLPSRVIGGWLTFLIDAGSEIDVDIFLQKETPDKVQRRLRYIHNNNRSNLDNAQASNPNYYMMANMVRAGELIKSGLAAGEDFFYFGIMVTIAANSKEELEWKVRQMRSYCKSMDIDLLPFRFRQLDAFRASLPLCSIEPTLFKAMRRNALTSSVATMYPFSSPDINDERGIFLGRNAKNESLIFLDPFNAHKYQNGNMTILGMSGAGKSYLLQNMALRFRTRQIQTFVIAPEKGHEFIRPCRAIGGQYIRLGGGSPQNINVLGIRKQDTTNAKTLYGDAESNDSILVAKIQQLHIFFRLLVPDISVVEQQCLDKALVAAYERYGITANNRSLEDPNRPGQYKRMPVLGDVQTALRQQGRQAERLAGALNRFVDPTGSLHSFNQQTNVDLENKYVAIDVSQLPDDLVPLGMFIALDYIWSKVLEDPTANKIIFIDEVWKLLGSDAPVLCRNFIKRIWRLIRGYGGGVVGATQNLAGFFSTEADAADVIGNSAINFLLKNKAADIGSLQSVFGLTNTEADQIVKFHTGDALLCAGSSRVLMHVDASRTEHNLVTTSAEELRQLTNY